VQRQRGLPKFALAVVGLWPPLAELQVLLVVRPIVVTAACTGLPPRRREYERVVA